MNTKHTPGPWRFETQRGTSKLARIWTDVGDITVNTGTATSANARLIAAAPDLLAALERFINPLEKTTHDAQRERTSQASAAIAKATGKDK